MENLARLIIFFALLVLVSCNGEKMPVASSEVFYKRDMILEVGGVKGEGALVVPLKNVIPFLVTARGDLDLFTFTTCHREETAEDAGNVTERTGWLFKRTITKKREVKLDFRPTLIEGAGGCPVMLGGYEQSKGRHSWGFVDFETPEATLPAILNCNGLVLSVNGVSVCQARMGLIQSIKFPVSVRVSPEASCDLGKTEGDSFEFPIPKGQCVFAFMAQDERIHRLTTLGYEQILIRK